MSNRATDSTAAGDQRPKAHIREKVVGHMDAVVAVEHHEHTGHDEAVQVSRLASPFRRVREHRQRKHHAGDAHI